MFGGTYGDEVATHHFYQDLFPVAEFQAGKRGFTLICVVGKDGYTEGEIGESNICFWKAESRVTP
jgi:hypothetical protein